MRPQRIYRNVDHLHVTHGESARQSTSGTREMAQSNINNRAVRVP
ncbi:hypothetical protein [Streptomyces melanogenes]